jgi:hypothetical protein
MWRGGLQHQKGSLLASSRRGKAMERCKDREGPQLVRMNLNFSVSFYHIDRTWKMSDWRDTFICSIPEALESRRPNSSRLNLRID